MIHAKLTHFALPLSLAGLLLVAGCNKTQPQNNPEQPPANQPQTSQATPAPDTAQPGTAQPGTAQPAPNTPAPDNQMAQQPPAPAGPPPPPVPVSYTIPAGTRVTVRLSQTINSSTAHDGDRFDATVSSPIVVKGKTLVRSGSAASGRVVAANARGHIKGAAILSLRLDAIRVNGTSTPITSDTWSRELKGKGKRSAGFIGGGGGVGALIGGLAGGGKGALIGGLAGAGGGTAAGAFTGNKQIIVGSESPLTFRLNNSITVRQ